MTSLASVFVSTRFPSSGDGHTHECGIEVQKFTRRQLLTGGMIYSKTVRFNSQYLVCLYYGGVANKPNYNLLSSQTYQQTLAPTNTAKLSVIVEGNPSQDNCKRFPDRWRGVWVCGIHIQAKKKRARRLTY